MTKNKYININFAPLWKHIRVERTKKETLKTILFSNAPFLFKKFTSFQHWKSAQIFKENKNENVKQYHLKNNNELQQIKFAIVLHAFYFDLFTEIFSLLPSYDTVPFKLFITCPDKLKNKITQHLNNVSFDFDILTVKNHGRDILPFLKILPQVFDQGFNLVLKIHTKRSNHLNKKELWNTDLFSKLLGEKNIINAIKVFKSHPEVGMMGPEGNILPMSLYYGGNPARVEELCLKMGLRKEQLAGLNFVAGSMFYARKEVLFPVLALDLKDSDFEDENKQLDSTLAHTVERIFPAGLILKEMLLADTSSTPEKINCKLTLNHPYTL